MSESTTREIFRGYRFNSGLEINPEAAKFYKEELIPQLNVEMKEKLGDRRMEEKVIEEGYFKIQRKKDSHMNRKEWGVLWKLL